MKIIVEDYGCGTSSAFYDYEDIRRNIVFCSEENYAHVFKIKDEDLFFVGHDFLCYLWNNKDKVEHWKNYKNNKYVWAFERIDAIVPAWLQKSHACMQVCSTFVTKFFCSDEQDARKYNIEWLPQWASPMFYQKKQDILPTKEDKFLFSGQAFKPEYKIRTDLLMALEQDEELSKKLVVSNTSRSYGWDGYIANLLDYNAVLNPIGVLRACNTRAFEVLTSGRLLLQQVDEEFIWHKELLSPYKNVVMFTDFTDLKQQLSSIDVSEKLDMNNDKMYHENSIYARFEKLGLKIK